MPDVAVFTGGFDDAAFKVATHLVVSPGVSLKESSIIKALSSGVKIISELRDGADYRHYRLQRQKHRNYDGRGNG